jgi:hypothetical protein
MVPPMEASRFNGLRAAPQSVWIRANPRLTSIFAEEQMLNAAQELLDFYRHGQESVTA